MKLFPAIYMRWQSCKMAFHSELKEMDELALAGDGRHDSMGHSAKFCAYSLFCCDSPLNAVVDFRLVHLQRKNNVKNFFLG